MLIAGLPGHCHLCQKNNIMRKLLLACLIMASAMHAPAQENDEAAIRKMLDAQVVQWNAGNIEGYMKGYWESDSLVFIGAHGPRYGYEATLKRYKEAYPDVLHMGRLTSTIQSINRLNDEYYFIVGHWALKRPAGDIEGSYTPLLRKINGQWVIICDHSS